MEGKKMKVRCLVCDGKMSQVGDMWVCRECNFSHSIKEKNVVGNKKKMKEKCNREKDDLGKVGDTKLNGEDIIVIFHDDKNPKDIMFYWRRGFSMTLGMVRKEQVYSKQDYLNILKRLEGNSVKLENGLVFIRFPLREMGLQLTKNEAEMLAQNILKELKRRF